MKKQILFLSLLPFVTCQASDTQELWFSVAAVTRDYLVAASEGSKSADHARQQLISTYEKLSTVLQPYYSKTIVQEFSRHLKDLGTQTIALIESTKKNDAKASANAQEQLRTSSSILSSFLSKTNAYLTFCPTKALTDTYISSLISMVKNRFEKRWTDDSQSYNELRSTTAQLGHAMTQSLTDAFPIKKSMPLTTNKAID